MRGVIILGLIYRTTSGRSVALRGSASDPYAYKATEAALLSGDADLTDPDTVHAIKSIATSKGITPTEFIERIQRRGKW